MIAEGKGEELLVGTSRNFLLRGTFNDGFQVEVQVKSYDVIVRRFYFVASNEFPHFKVFVFSSGTH